MREDRCSHELPPLHYAQLIAAKTVFQLSTLTPPSNRNPQGVTLPRYLRLIAAGAVEAFSFHLSSVIFPLSSLTPATNCCRCCRSFTLTTFAVRNPRGATCSCTTRDLLLQRLSKLSAFIFQLSSFHFDNLCCSQPTRCNLQLHYARPVAAKAVEAFSFHKEQYLFCRLCRSLTSILCCIF